MKKLLAMLFCLSLLTTTACASGESSATPPVQEPPTAGDDAENEGDRDENTPEIPPDQTPEDTPDQTPTITGYIYCTGNGVNIRDAASVNSNVVGSASLGDKLGVIQKGSK